MKKQKFISLLISFMMLFTMLPFSALIASAAETAIQILQQPQYAYADSGEQAVIKVRAEGDGLSYKWYFRNPGTKSFLYTSTFKSNTYTIPSMDASRNGREVYCVVSDKYGNSVKTDTVKLVLGTPLNITEQPKSAVAQNGKTAVIRIKAEGDDLKYKWYFRNPGTKSFLYTSTFKENTYTIPSMDASRHGREVYCVVSDKYGNSVKTDTVKLILGTPLNITEQPKDAIVPNGQTAVIRIKAEGEGLTYKWYFRNPGTKSFLYTSTFKENTYTIPTMDMSRNSREVYCVVSDKYGNSIKSETVYLLSTSSFQVTKEPESVFVDYFGADCTFTVETEGNSNLKYQWQKYDDTLPEYGWVDINYSDRMNFTGYDTASMTALSMSYDSRMHYRCIITSDYGEIYFTEVASVLQDIHIFRGPEDYRASAGEPAYFTVDAIGEALTYKWQYKNDYFDWTDISADDTAYTGADSESLTVLSYNPLDFAQYRCIVKDMYGNTVTTHWATCFEKPVITQQPESWYVRDEYPASFSLLAEGESVQYQWQYYDEENGWSDLSDNEKYTGSNTATLDIVNADPADRIRYRCLVTDIYNATTISDEVTILAWLQIITQPDSFNCNEENDAVFTVEAIGDDLTYQWQYCDPALDEYDWQNIITEYAEYSGSDTDTLIAYDINPNWDLLFRCVITDRYGNSVTSNPTFAYYTY